MTQTILVVDDMITFRKPVESTLRNRGFRVLSASNGMEALNLVYTADPALVLLDLSMPVMDGLTALARIRKSPHAGRIPVIVMSAANERPLVLQAAKLGIAGYILKSQFSIKTMMQRISDALKTSNTNAIAAAP